jgi:hypothetical protein
MRPPAPPHRKLRVTDSASVKHITPLRLIATAAWRLEERGSRLRMTTLLQGQFRCCSISRARTIRTICAISSSERSRCDEGTPPARPGLGIGRRCAINTGGEVRQGRCQDTRIASQYLRLGDGGPVLHQIDLGLGDADLVGEFLTIAAGKT